MRKSNWLVFLLFFTAGAANAHKDRILSVKPDGLIPEIPASFGRVSLNIKGLGSAAPMVQFRVGKYLTDLPSCVTRVIRTKSQSDIRITGSWHHDEEIVPYYVNVEFYDPGYDRGRLSNSNYSFLFNLRTAQLISITRFEANRSGNGGTNTTIELPKGCQVSSSKGS
jgi:hypothetical protein